MPMAIPLIVAAVDVGVGIAATDALVGGVMIAAGAFTAVGAITGDKTLSQIGMVAGIVGGGISAWESLGTAAASDGAAGAVGTTGADYGDAAVSIDAGTDVGAGLTDAADTTGAMSAESASTTSGFGGVGTDAATTGTGGADFSGGIINGSSPGAADAASAAAAPGTSAAVTPTAAPSSPGLIGGNTTAPNPIQDVVTADNGTGAAASSTGSSTPDFGGSGTDPAASGVNSGVNGSPGTVGSTNAQTSTGWGQKLSQMQDWVKNNPTSARMIGGILQGAMNNANQRELLKEKYGMDQSAIQANINRNSASLTGLTVPTYQPPPPKG